MKARAKVVLLPGLVLCLVGCGGAEFTGTYTGSYLQQVATVTLQEDGNRLTGSVQWGGGQGSIDATVSDNKAQGTVQNASVGLKLRFEATLRDDENIDWVYHIKNPFTGESRKMPFLLTRQRASARPPAAQPPAAAGGQRDPRLVGRWRRTVGGNTGVGPGGLITSTDIYCTLSANGTFVYGGAVTGAVSPDFNQFVGPGNTVRGIWKTEGQILYSKPQGSERWIPLGRYAVSGSGLVLYAGNQKQYWER